MLGHLLFIRRLKSGDYETLSVLFGGVHLFIVFYINLYMSFFYKDISSKYVENVYCYENMCKQRQKGFSGLLA